MNPITAFLVFFLVLAGLATGQWVNLYLALPLFVAAAIVAAALGGLDTLVFAGGIDENAPIVRARICAGLEFLGIELEEKRNVANEGVISAAAGRVAVRVIRTNEELMIAEIVGCFLGLDRKKKF